MRGICLLSSTELHFLGVRPAEGGKEVGFDLQVPFEIYGARTGEGQLELKQTGPGDARVPALGDALSAWHDRSLLLVLLKAFFSDLRRQLGTSEATSFRLITPLWLGRRQLVELREAAAGEGIYFREGQERGLELAAIHATSSEPPPQGGWLVVDQCAPDIDVYAVADERRAGQRWLRLTGYRRLQSALTPSSHRANKLRDMPAILGTLPRDWPIITNEQGVAELLRENLPAQLLRDTGVTPFRFQEDENLVVGSYFDYWLDHGDQRLEPLLQGVRTFPARSLRLLELPEDPPESLELAIRVGYFPLVAETREVCRLQRKKGDYHTDGGHLLVELQLDAAERGELKVELFQRGGHVDLWRQGFPATTEEQIR